jgi:hypothetical protein
METITSRNPTLVVKERGPHLKTWDDTAAVQADEGGAQQLVWQLGRQLETGILPGQRKSRNIQGFSKKF